MIHVGSQQLGSDCTPELTSDSVRQNSPSEWPLTKGSAWFSTVTNAVSPKTYQGGRHMQDQLGFLLLESGVPPAVPTTFNHGDMEK